MEILDLQPGGRIGDYPYRIVRKLGVRVSSQSDSPGNTAEGAMSHIYLAEVDERAGELVVLKISNVFGPHAEFHAQAFRNEVDHLTALKHPGIIHIFPVTRRLRNRAYRAKATLPGEPWFAVLEYLPGGSLASFLAADSRPLEPGLAIAVAYQLAVTLDYVHSKGIVHLDLSPQNILLRRPIPKAAFPEPVLIDFGISRHIGQTGLLAGKPYYVAPERLASRADRSPAGNLDQSPHPSMDIYALGIILYQMLTGKLPFRGRSNSETTAAILAGEPTKPSAYLGEAIEPEVADISDEVILQCIAREPAERPTAAHLASKLEEASFRLGYPYRNLVLSHEREQPTADIHTMASPTIPAPDRTQRSIHTNAMGVPHLPPEKAAPQSSRSRAGTGTLTMARQVLAILSIGVVILSAIFFAFRQPGSPAQPLATATATDMPVATATELAPDLTATVQTPMATTSTAVAVLETSATTPEAEPTPTPTATRDWPQVVLESPGNDAKPVHRETFRWRNIGGPLLGGEGYNVLFCRVVEENPGAYECIAKADVANNSATLHPLVTTTELTVDVADLSCSFNLPIGDQETYWWTVGLFRGQESKPHRIVANEYRTIHPKGSCQ